MMQANDEGEVREQRRCRRRRSLHAVLQSMLRASPFVRFRYRV
jgi:hypothetical protein